MKFGTDRYIIVIKSCAFGLICNYLENQHIQYGAQQPSWISKIKIAYIVVLLRLIVYLTLLGSNRPYSWLILKESGR